MATHSSLLAWEIAWTEEPGGLQTDPSTFSLHQKEKGWMLGSNNDKRPQWLERLQQDIQTSSNTQLSVGVHRILNFLELTVGKEIEKTLWEGNLMRCIKNLKRLDTIMKVCHFQEGILNKQVQKY